MKVLLDTHTLLWAALEPGFLSKKAATTIANPATMVFVSAASAWEIATKVRNGRLPAAAALERDFERVVEDAGYELLSIDVPCALRAARLPGEHRDPFDRMLAAQALVEDLLMVSRDAKMDGFGVRRIW